MMDEFSILEQQQQEQEQDNEHTQFDPNLILNSLSSRDNFEETRSISRKKRKRSVVWNHFTVIDNNCAGRIFDIHGN